MNETIDVSTSEKISFKVAPPHDYSTLEFATRTLHEVLFCQMSAHSVTNTDCSSLCIVSALGLFADSCNALLIPAFLTYGSDLLLKVTDILLYLINI
jgi:hypothetical protein